MRFDSAGRVEEIVYAMRLAELERSENRAILDRLFNGQPPFDEATAEENGVQINRNFLEGVNLLAQARRSWNGAHLKSGNYFKVTLDSGPVHKRTPWSKNITRNINRPLKRSMDYMEAMRSNGANTVLHGIGPSNWESRTAPYHVPLGVDDVLVPSETLVGFRNLDHFAIYRQWSPATLYQLTHGPKRDPGWNMPLVNSELKRLSTEYQKNAYSAAYQFMPEKVEELIKGDMGFWGSDAAPTVDTWDLYFREAEDGNGWYRRVILDSGISSEARAAYQRSGTRPHMTPRGAFLYTSGKRKFANSLRNILHCQFGDTSAVAPFRYHSVRSLGYMLWGVCELQNRLRCKFTEAVFEQLMWFFRVSSQGDFTRLKKALFSHMGVIPEGINFVTAEERFKPDHQLVDLLLSQNRQLMGENAASFVQDMRQGNEKEMTATETMARVNSVNSLVSGMLNLSYIYETFQYRETCRRFCIDHSPHLEVRNFRLACLKDGVPAEMLDVDRWDIEPERALGSGNKTLEIAQAQQLLQMRPTLGPEAQQEVDHIAIEAFTDDPALAEHLVPIAQQVPLSSAKKDAQLAVGSLMSGASIQWSESDNRRDIIETLLLEMALIVKRLAAGGMASASEIAGLQNIGGHIGQLIQFVSQDKSESERVKKYSQQLGNLMNAVKSFAQRLAEQQRAIQANGDGGNGKAAETQGKIRAMQITAQAKAANTRESHAQRTAQRQVQFEAEQRQKEEEHRLEMQRQIERQGVEDAAHGMKTAAEIHRDSLKSLQE